jgi:hypothetical protein
VQREEGGGEVRSIKGALYLSSQTQLPETPKVVRDIALNEQPISLGIEERCFWRKFVVGERA